MMTTTPVRRIPARVLIGELVGRLGEAETRRRAGLPASTDLGQLAAKLDRRGGAR